MRITHPGHSGGSFVQPKHSMTSLHKHHDMDGFAALSVMHDTAARGDRSGSPKKNRHAGSAAADASAARRSPLKVPPSTTAAFQILPTGDAALEEHGIGNYSTSRSAVKQAYDGSEVANASGLASGTGQQQAPPPLDRPPVGDVPGTEIRGGKGAPAMQSRAAAGGRNGQSAEHRQPRQPSANVTGANPGMDSGNGSDEGATPALAFTEGQRQLFRSKVGATEPAPKATTQFTALTGIVHACNQQSSASALANAKAVGAVIESDHADGNILKTSAIGSAYSGTSPRDMLVTESRSPSATRSNIASPRRQAASLSPGRSKTQQADYTMQHGRSGWHSYVSPVFNGVKRS